MRKTACLFCSARNNPQEAIVWISDHFLVFMDKRPIRRGHTLIAPLRHRDDPFAMPPTEYSSIMQVIPGLANAMRKCFGPKRVGLLVSGKEIPEHCHFHLVPMDDGIHGTFSGMPKQREAVRADLLAADAALLREAFKEGRTDAA